MLYWSDFMKKIITSFTVFAFLLLCSCSNKTDTGIADAISSPDISNITSSTSTSANSEDDNITASETTTTEHKYEDITNPDIRNLKWGMSIEEVKHYETEINYVENVNSDNNDQTLLTYSNVGFDGYITEMTLCVTDGFGLDGVNYRIQDDKFEEIYSKFVNEYGKPTYDYSDDFPNASWEIEKDNIIIFLYTL